ncbi:M28 family peptidase [Actinoplanes sp. NBRC 103695]|uniref:M28 family peptidase n=1 Tax=Actinoplanes sp. NBRC 103695 TaxID=3032202 RepID=UPI002556B5C4|nr:M28 family peptidase [Actinoplanes sp. NBRC 103695]
MSRRKILTTAAGGVAGLALPAPAWAVGDRRPGATRPPSLTPGDQQVAAKVSARRALTDLRALTETIGPRVAGTPGERRAADYLGGVFDDLGYDTTLQPFAVEDKYLARLDAPGGLPRDLCWQAGASPYGALDVTVRAGVIDAGIGGSDDYPANVAGRIVLIDNPWLEDPGVLAGRAIERGAAAVVFLAEDLFAGLRAPAWSPWLPEPVAVPVVGAAWAQKIRLRELLAAGQLRELIVSTSAHRGLTSHNVLAERRTGNGDGPVVMVSAHYDSVVGAPGANDDGSGTVLCLELARVLRTMPANATLRFGLWGAEEDGTVGSLHYVSQLPQVERDRIVALFHNDMVATTFAPATRYWLLSATGEANRATAEVAAAARRLGYASRISPVTQRGFSDHESFQQAGIAAANFSWRSEESPADLEPQNHTPEDTIAANISPERLQVSMELIGAAAYNTLHDPV